MRRSLGISDSQDRSIEFTRAETGNLPNDALASLFLSQSAIRGRSPENPSPESQTWIVSDQTHQYARIPSEKKVLRATVLSANVDVGRWVNRSVLLPLLDRRRGTRSLRVLPSLIRNEHADPRDAREDQFRLLKALIRHAYEHVPFYRASFDRAGVRPESLRTWDDYSKFPTVTREKIRGHANELRSTDGRKRPTFQMQTGGSTGRPLKYTMDAGSATYGIALRWRGWGYAGFRLGDPRATLAGLSLLNESTRLRLLVRQRLMERNLPLPALNLDRKRVEDYARQLRRFRPRFLQGYPTSIAFLARSVEGLDRLNLDGVLTTGETLLPVEREAIEEAFGCRVYDTYGADDGGVSAFECGVGEGMHIDTERGLMEFVRDGDRVAPGEQGEILATDLRNYAMPFIRYAVGDVGIPLEDPCPCGRTLPRLKSLLGRTTDLLTFENVTVTGPALTLVFAKLDVLDYLVRRLSNRQMHVSVVEGGSKVEDVEAALNRYLPDVPEIVVEAVPEIQRASGSKRKFILAD